MGIVLSKATHAGQTMKLAALLVAVNCSEFGQSQGQIAVGARKCAENLAVVGAVHRLEQVLFAFLGGVDGLERVLAVFGVVAGGHIKLFVAYMGGYNLLIAIAALDFAQELFEAVAQGCSFGKPQWQAGTYFGREREQFHFLAELAVVAFLRLLQKCQILVEHRLLGEGYAIDTYQLGTFFIATPVSSCQRHHLHGLDRRGGREMRATAKVGELPLGIGGYVSVLQLGNKLALICFVAFAEEVQRIGFGYVGTHNLLVLLCQFEHLCLDFGKIGRCEGVFARVDIVVETVFYRRTDAEFHTGI